jgi:hypothetical protein
VLQPLHHHRAPCRHAAAASSSRRGAAARCAAAADEERGWRQGVKRFDFTYMGPADAAAAEAEAAAAWQAGMDDYTALQEWLLFRTWRFGVLFAGYLLLAASGEVSGSQLQRKPPGSVNNIHKQAAPPPGPRRLGWPHTRGCTRFPPGSPPRTPQAAFCELVGTAAGYGYLKWLISDVSRLQPGDAIPLRAAEAVEPRALRWAAKLAATYRHALQPRLLVLPGLAGAVAAWNAALPDAQLGPVEQGCLLGGFLSWKVRPHAPSPRPRSCGRYPAAAALERPPSRARGAACLPIPRPPQKHTHTRTHANQAMLCPRAVAGGAGAAHL